nr:Rho GTPase-activating protein 3-like [Tanacetum cinerariifolium]
MGEGVSEMEVIGYERVQGSGSAWKAYMNARVAGLFLLVLLEYPNGKGVDETSRPLLYAGWMAGPYWCKDVTRGRNDDPVTSGIKRQVGPRRTEADSFKLFSQKVLKSVGWAMVVGESSRDVEEGNAYPYCDVIWIRGNTYPYCDVIWIGSNAYPYCDVIWIGDNAYPYCDVFWIGGNAYPYCDVIWIESNAYPCNLDLDRARGRNDDPVTSGIKSQVGPRRTKAESFKLFSQKVFKSVGCAMVPLCKFLMTTLFRSKSCGSPPRPKASFFHYSSSYSNQQDDSDNDDELCYYYDQDYSPITTPFISPHQQAHANSNQNIKIASILCAALRKSMLTCSVHDSDDVSASFDIGCPTDVQHVTHVTFDRFNGFIGLPLDFQLDVPRKAPSASVCVFGVSVESMQCSYDERGNSVPTILLMMQNRLYSEGGLQAEGIFRITGGNRQEEDVRKQLNRGFVPDGVDVHCLAGLIKAWFRELPTGVLDSVTPEHVIHCNTEDECTQLAKSLPPTEAALLDWAINLMADVVKHDQQNKMNARNIAMVFAPNMTQMADPLTALIHAVQIMNLLKTLIIKTLREKEESSSDFEPLSLCANNRSPNNKVEHPYLLKNALIYGILGRLHLRKGVRKLCRVRYPAFQLSKPSKKTGTMIVDARGGGELKHGLDSYKMSKTHCL